MDEKRMRGWDAKGHKLVDTEAGLLDDCGYCAFGQIARMARDRGPMAGLRVPPDLMAASGLAVEDEASSPEFAGNIADTKAGEAAHQPTATAMVTSSGLAAWSRRAGGSSSPCST